MSSIVICVMCGDTWEVPDEAYPLDGKSLCDICAGQIERVEVLHTFDHLWDDTPEAEE